MNNLPKELTELVDWSVTTLGLVIRSEVGSQSFRTVEKIRQLVKTSEGQSCEGLLALKKELSKKPDTELYHIAHAFGLMLELINSCESAYRVSRIKAEPASILESHAHKGRLIHVLTAHPTESRNPHILPYLSQIQHLLERRLHRAHKEQQRELFLLLKMAWLVPLAKQKSPTVMDEADYIYSLSLKPELIDLYLLYAKSYQTFYLRTWVGGDKDGHPGVDESSLAGSLTKSRGYLLQWLNLKLSEELQQYSILEAQAESKTRVSAYCKELRNLQKYLVNLKTIEVNDIKKIFRLREILMKAQDVFSESFLTQSLLIERIQNLLKIFPGLVVPIELREESALVQEAVNAGSSKFAITRMLQYLKRISAGEFPRFYVRSLILSQCESAQDMSAGVELIKKVFKEPLLPVVPLFESAHSLNLSSEIIESFLKKAGHRSIVKKFWLGNLEIMVGYSDSAKENGAFASRYFVAEALQRLDGIIHQEGLVPIYFHGSGGSIERGGGSVQEQTEWWPSSALSTVKVTVQGEMIYRNYASPEILMRQMERFVESREKVLSSNRKNSSVDHGPVLMKMSKKVSEQYRQAIHDEEFLNMIEKATPYSFLSSLKLGSRPSKRANNLTVESLRAIPWVLCWTQTRTLFPTWWGIGTFWEQCSADEKNQLKQAFRSSPLIASYFKVLSFTLKKVELEVFKLYLESSELPKKDAIKYFQMFRDEFEKSLKAVQGVTGEQELLWYRPWLGKSIELRSPLIHPLNVLQIISLERKDLSLLRESATGIASGMLTTG